jgi:hypothetical protein
MSDDVTYWASVRQELVHLVERLYPDDALRLVKELVQEENAAQLAPALAGLIKGYVDRRTDERQSERDAL